MRIGVSPWGSSLTGVRSAAAAAAEAGVDTLWLGDGLLAVADFPPWSGGMEPFVELAWLAGAYPSLGVGVGAAVLPLRDVLWVAKQSATLDQLTRGRFFLVVTPGIWEREFTYRGLSFRRRGDQFEDLLGALRAAFDGRGYAGKAVALPDDGRLSPLPFTPGGPPLWLAGERPTMERALTHGLPFQARALTPQTLGPLAREWFDRGGSELAVRIALELADQVGGPSSGPSPAQTNRIAGPAGHLLEQLNGFADLGVSDVSLMPGRDDLTSRRTIEALGSAILPALRGRL